MRLIFSRDRPAQLDLLLRSLEANAEPDYTVVIWRSDDLDFIEGYERVRRLHTHDNFTFAREWQTDFETLVRATLWGNHDGGKPTPERTLLLCDDDVLYRPWREWRYWPESLLCFSLRLGRECVTQYPTGFDQSYPGSFYHWPSQSIVNGDFGYPGSIDGHQFRTADLRRMLAGKTFPNPTALECALVEGCNELASERPMISIYSEQRLVGVPVNRVSEQSNVRHGARPELSAAALNERFLAGERLSLEAMDFSAVDAAHCELSLLWDATLSPSRQVA